MGIFHRIFGISETPKAPGRAWKRKGKEIVVNLDRADELEKPGGSVRLEGMGLKNRILLFKGDDGEFRAFHNKCACAGWRLDHHPGTSTVQCCTLGRSTYDYNGNVLKGSARHAVKTYSVKQDGRKIIISTE